MANTPPLSARDLMDMRRRLRGPDSEAPSPAPATDDLLGPLGPTLDAPPEPSEEHHNTHGAANGRTVHVSEAEIVRSVESELRRPAELPPLFRAPVGDSETDRLRAENAELRSVLADLRKLMEEMSQHDPDLLLQQIAELEGKVAQLEAKVAQKDEGNRQLHAQLEEIEQQFAAVNTAPPTDADLAALSDELERERCQLAQERKQLEEERRQLREDDEHLMQQTREMEVTMARERAEMARQRTELTRLHGEIRHELEAMQRDGALTARLAQFQRKHQEMMVRHGVAGAEPVAPAAAPPPSAQQAPASPKRDSGVLRRLFGSR